MQPVKPNADLTLFLGALNGAFRLWDVSIKLVKRLWEDEDVSDEELAPHLAYLAEVRAATSRLYTPAGGEGALRALLSAMDGRIGSYQALLEEDEPRAESHQLDTLEDYEIFQAEISRVSSLASGGLLQ